MYWRVVTVTFVCTTVSLADVSECTQSMDDALIVLYCTSVQLQLLLANQ